MILKNLFISISSVLLGYALTYELFTLVYDDNICIWYTENKIAFVAVGYVLTSDIKKTLNFILK